MTRTKILAIAALAVIPASSTLLADRDAEKVKQELGTQIYREWDAAAKKDLDGFLENYSQEVTGFEQTSPYLEKGLTVIRKIRQADFSSPGETVVNNMANPHIQVYGDVAILTYNFVGLAKDKDGKIFTINAKSTRVYVRQDRSWKVVHFHFSN